MSELRHQKALPQRFQFSIRWVLLLTVLAAVVVASAMVETVLAMMLSIWLIPSFAAFFGRFGLDGSHGLAIAAGFFTCVLVTTLWVVLGASFSWFGELRGGQSAGRWFLNAMATGATFGVVYFVVPLLTYSLFVIPIEWFAGNRNR